MASPPSPCNPENERRVLTLARLLRTPAHLRFSLRFSLGCPLLHDRPHRDESSGKMEAPDMTRWLDHHGPEYPSPLWKPRPDRGSRLGCGLNIESRNGATMPAIPARRRSALPGSTSVP